MDNVSAALTFDIDWNADYIVQNAIDLCDDLKVPATFFITHKSKVVDRLKSTHHERGLHPNFGFGSTHGSTPEEVLDHVSALAPEAVSIRSHGLTNSSSLFAMISNRCPRVWIESNVLLPMH